MILFLRYLNFCSEFLGHVGKRIDKKAIRLISNFIMSQAGMQIITIYLLPNISRIKGNQTVKLGQLIEYNMRNIFLEDSYKKCSWGTSPRTIQHISGLTAWNFIRFVFILRRSQELPKYIKNKVLTTCSCFI